MTYSFDIFDTLITRLCYKPDTIFYIIQQELCTFGTYSQLDSLLKEDFVSYRKFAEHTARSKNPHDDISIVDIYLQLQEDFLLSDTEKAVLMDLELQTELKFSVPIEENIQKVKTLIAAGENVIFISDMYLRGVDIRMLLSKHVGKVFDNCTLYTSSDYGVTKKRGGLYKAVLEDLNVEPNRILHTGDNYKSDIVMAKKHGIRTSFYQSTTTVERWMQKSFCISSSISNENVNEMIHLGLCRYMFLLNGISADLILALLGAPLLIGFIKWLKTQLPKDSKVFFLARDGEFLLELYKYLYSSADISYLPISRQAVVPGSCNSVDEFVAYLVSAYPHLSIDMVCQRSHLSYERLVEMCGKLPHKHKYLNKKQIAQMKSKLLDSKDFRSYVTRFIDDQKKEVVNYLESIQANNRLDIVDLGWKCTIQDSIKKIVPDVSIQGFYWGVSQQSDFVSFTNKKKAFFFYPGAHLSSEMVKLCIVFSELICSSNLSVVTHYYHGEPVYLESGLEKKWISDCRKQVFTYLELIKQTDFDLDYNKIINKNLNVLHNPGKELATVLGDLVYSADPLDTDNIQLAPKFSLFSLFKSSLNVTWFQGRLSRSNGFLKSIFKARKHILKIIRKLLNRFKR